MAEAVHKNQLKELNNKFHVIRTKFQQLDQRISKVSHTAVRTGQQLEAVNKNKRKIVAGKEMIRQFLEFNSGDKTQFDPIFRDFSDPNRLKAAARQIQQLQKYSNQFRGEKTEVAKASIEETADEIEKHLLRRFETELSRSNLGRMKDLASTLCCFQSQKVVFLYVNRVISKIPEAHNDLKGLSVIDPRAFKEISIQFFERIVTECEKAFDEVIRVFPAPSNVMVQILTRIFTERIQKFIHKASKTEVVGDYLRILEEAHRQTEAAARDLARLKKEALDRMVEEQLSASGNAPSTALATGLVNERGTNVLLGLSGAYTNASPAIPSVPYNLYEANGGTENADIKFGAAGSGVKPLARLESDRKEEFKFSEQVREIFQIFQQNYLEKELALLRSECTKIIQGSIQLDERQREELNDKSIFGKRKKGTKGSRALKHWVLTALDGLQVAGAPPSPRFEGFETKGVGSGSSSISSHRNGATTRSAFGAADTATPTTPAGASGTLRPGDSARGGGGQRDYKASDLSHEGEHHKARHSQRLRTDNAYGQDSKGQSPCGIERQSNQSATARVLRMLTAALHRAERLAGEVPQCCDRLAKEAWNQLLTTYVATALDVAEQVLPDEDPKEDPDTRFFLRVVGSVNRIAERMNEHYRTHVLPRLEADLNIKSRGSSANRKALRKIETRLLKGLRMCLNAVIKYVERMMSRQQRPSDFKPKDEMDCFDYTEACRNASTFIAIQGECAVESLQGRNLDTYLANLGKRFYKVVTAHLRRYQVSPLGAMVVSLDVKRFQDVVQEFHIEEVSRMFSTLRDMASLLLLPVEQLGMVVQQRLASVPKEDLHEFLKSRADYNRQRIQIISLLNL